MKYIKRINEFLLNTNRPNPEDYDDIEDYLRALNIQAINELLEELSDENDIEERMDICTSILTTLRVVHDIDITDIEDRVKDLAMDGASFGNFFDDDDDEDIDDEDNISPDMNTGLDDDMNTGLS